MAHTLQHTAYGRKLDSLRSYTDRRGRLCFATRTYDLSIPHHRAQYVARERYAWPGGYELFAVCDDGGSLCFDCCRTEYRHIRNAEPRSGWHIVGIDSAANVDGFQVDCDHCYRTICHADDEA